MVSIGRVRTPRRWTSGDIAAELRRRILSGEVPAHARIGTIASLAQEFQVARGTIGLAVKRLPPGLVTAVPGSGIFVTDPAERPDPEGTGDEDAAARLAAAEARILELEQLAGELHSYVIDLYSRMGVPYPGWPRGMAAAVPGSEETGTRP